MLHATFHDNSPSGNMKKVKKAKVANVETTKILKVPLDSVEDEMEDIEVPQLGPTTRLCRKDKGMTPIDSVSKKVLSINKEVIMKNDKLCKLMYV